ncbi:MAG: glycosyltransferase family 39 protein [Roseiflexus sp.]|nr:glycosyltransferase family 39 protein [Roseiflexus sp.]MCS7291124.1 glycosyltransferase family 39 protein [Roseiflexus sp.]MDW8232067.1 glycosyltransferase family 39 protein [Roseiflexaceae bacterium]
MIHPEAHSTPHLQTTSMTVVVYRILVATLFVIAALLATINLPYAPPTWFDEGSHLHVPKTLVQYGKYADLSATPDGNIEFRYHGPTVGIGPTVVLPVAAAYQVFGIGLTQGRLVIVIYFAIALVAGYTLASRLYGRWTALIALALLLASRTVNYEGLIEYGRQVLGEVPGVAFVFLGMLAWLAALRTAAQPEMRRAHWTWSVLAGLGFGLALVTKNQFVLIIPLALALIALLDWRYYRAGTWTLRLIPLTVAIGCFALWMAVQFALLGPGTFFENLQQTRQAAGGAIFVFNLRSTLRAGYYLLRPDLFGGLVVPALAYTVWRARCRTSQGLSEALMALIIGLWLAWFVGASLGWPRYAFPAVALSALTVARLAFDTIVWLRRVLPVAATVAATYLIVIIALPIALTARVVFTPDDSAQQFAAYLNANVPETAIIATWEPELGVLTDHRYLYPPQAMLDRAVRQKWLEGDPVRYDWYATRPEYLVVGSFGGYTGVFETPELERHYIRVAQIGTYTLFMHR